MLSSACSIVVVCNNFAFPDASRASTLPLVDDKLNSIGDFTARDFIETGSSAPDRVRTSLPRSRLRVAWAQSKDHRIGCHHQDRLRVNRWPLSRSHYVRNYIRGRQVNDGRRHVHRARIPRLSGTASDNFDIVSLQ